MASNTIGNEVYDLNIVRGTIDAVPSVLGLLDTAVKWLVSHGRTGQWGTKPFSENSRREEQLREFATSGHGIWLAVKVPKDTSIRGQTQLSQAMNGEASGVIVGALAIGERSPYVTPVSEPELYVRLLVTDRECAGKQIGKRLLNHARDLAREDGVSLLRVDCYAGGDGKLIQYYESQGFNRVEILNGDGDWPCQVLAQRLDEMKEGERS
ncbi:hypothetical protein N7486_005608 [Penicillium sp. IBT 16267x]|nr:hypothetical protein N7486_005608 [Penicillium sp. IBT 16267x]